MEELASVKLYNARISTQKARLLADKVRGKLVYDALNILSFYNKKAAIIIKKILKYAIYNVETKNINIDILYISTIYINRSVFIKRSYARAKGRTDRLMKPSCNIIVKLRLIKDQLYGSKSQSYWN
ncbi:50S ribosomal protein L22 [Candidatus Johnevansia muelleri]|uniref:Large ribosomal subunit protein uL22 n=1 Tax=Candidatus Johnevansia muelleri TaxID=1495769 RepID=A0A078KEB9_9GAMM|nr:50S ribosomal protein L22 [Candidatus Evansia muelleri]